ncbi:MAG: hypothetical protein DCC75_00560 [Proteobacteria bacterium]|nr:MAG: hypothetical protein DCC75_00560 [Pseudomonadota bacterium]
MLPASLLPRRQLTDNKVGACIGFDISALDSTFKSHAQRGIGRYVGELSSYFKRELTSSKQALKIENFDHSSVRAGSSGLLKVCSNLTRLTPCGRTTINQQLLYPLQLSRYTHSKGRGFDALHFPAHMDAPAWGLRRYALTVLDLIPLVLEPLYRANKSGLRFKFARWLEIQAIKNATLVIAISQNTAADVQRILGVPEERICVTPLGVDQKFFAAKLIDEEETLRRRYKLEPKAPIVLYVGGIDPRKNCKGLIGSLALLQQKLKQQGKGSAQLLMAGEIRSDREFPRLSALIEEHGLTDSIKLAGFVPDHDLLQLYRISSVFFFPSLYEGFGLPPLEAMAAGLPVVSSARSSMSEVLGQGAMLVNPEDIEQCAEALFQVLSSNELARELEAKGRKQAGLFSWQKTGELTLQAYEKLLAQ